MFKFLRRKPRVPDDPNQILIDRIKSIQPSKMGAVFSSDYINLGIRTPFKSIIEYNQYLKQVADSLQSKGPIPKRFFQYDPFFVSLRDWFVSPTGFYLDPEAQTIVFQHQAENFVHRFIATDKIDGEQERQQIIHVGPILKQIREITDQFIVVSDSKTITNESSIRKTDF